MPHPDEGLIHAWLDGELDAAEHARIEELVRTDPAWAAAVAEARGLIAASSRIVGALDIVPGNVAPARKPAPARARRPWWTMRVAALLVIAAGSAVVLSRSNPSAELDVARDGKSAAVVEPRTLRQQARYSADEVTAAPKKAVGPAAGPAAGTGGLGAKAPAAPAPVAKAGEKVANALATQDQLARAKTDDKEKTALKKADLQEPAGRAFKIEATLAAPAPKDAPVLDSVRQRAMQVAGAAAGGAVAPAAAPQPNAAVASRKEVAPRPLAPLSDVVTTSVASERRDAAANVRADSARCYAVREPVEGRGGGAGARFADARASIFRLPAAAAPNIDSATRSVNALAKTLPSRALHASGDSIVGAFSDGRRFVAVRVTCPAP